MSTQNWFNEVPFAITVCDEKGIVLDMNEKSALTFSKDGGKTLIGKSLLDCHSEKSKRMILEMMKSEEVNIYTIEKNGIKKLIYQCPWYVDGKMSGLVELSLALPNDIPHFVRG
ncbi:MAG: diguanylate cyclase [Anaerolinea sp.]|nr:diguanylate cyclase [Anaerolinea sp.]